MEKSVGLYQYSSAGSQSTATRILTKLQTKCRLRAELAQIQAELDAMIPACTRQELRELQDLMVQAADATDADVAALQVQVKEERKLAQTTKSQVVRISRRSVAALAAEAQKRIERGHYPSTAFLVDESVQLLYGKRL